MIRLTSANLSACENDCACVNGNTGNQEHHKLKFVKRSALRDDAQVPQWRISQQIFDYPLAEQKHLVVNMAGEAKFMLLDQHEYEFFSSFRSSGFLAPSDVYSPATKDNIFVNRWAEDGFLTSPEMDCACIPANEATPVTLTAWLHITDRCNLRCSYCYLPHVLEDMSDCTGMESLNSLFRSAVAHGYKQVKIKYAGGEPLLRFSFIQKLHQYARSLADEHGLTLQGVILSNGTLLTEEMIQAMLDLELRLSISLDGLGRFHDLHRPYAGGRGSFKDVIEAVELALSKGLTPNISITISNRTVAGLPELIGWVLQHNLPFSFNFYRENEFSTSPDDLRLNDKEIISGLRKAFSIIEHNLPVYSLLSSLVDRADLSKLHLHPCGVNQNYLVFDQNGRVSRCQMDLRNPISDYHDSDPLLSIRSSNVGLQNVSVEQKDKCRNCEWKYYCAGGCPLLAKRTTGYYDKNSPYCSIYKVLFPEVIRLEGLRLMKYQDNPLIVQKIKI